MDFKKLSQKKFILKLSTNDNINQKILDVMKENKLVSSNTIINKFEIINGEERKLIVGFNNKLRVSINWMSQDNKQVK